MLRTMLLAASASLLLAGCDEEGPIQPSTQPANAFQFVLPLTPGTQWHYTYFYESTDRLVGGVSRVHGYQTWQVSSRTGAMPPFSAVISVGRIDTIHNSVSVANIDTTYVTRADTSFIVTVNSDSVSARWADLMSLASFDPVPTAFPRLTKTPVDTLILSGRYGWAHARYVNGSGLLDWSVSAAYGSGMEISSLTERLTMVSSVMK